MNRNAHNPSRQHMAFLRSALCIDGAFLDTAQVVDWLKQRNDSVAVKIRRIGFSEIPHWRFDLSSGSLRHDSGRFFAIDGIRVRTNWGAVPQWDQPIINQPEVGYLGLIAKEFQGVLHFLMQAKIEPGNVNSVQLSPTLQATRSNYSQVHCGKRPLYLEYFQSATSDQIVLDQLQSEQGGRFLRKRNRNIIVQIDGDVPVYDNFVWLTLGQLKLLMRHDNLVNMDSRTVIAGIPFGSFREEVIDVFDLLPTVAGDRSVRMDFLRSALVADCATNTIDQIITFLTQLKSTYDLDVETVPLAQVSGWTVSDDTIARDDHRYFRVIAVDVEIGNREVSNWAQPMVEPAQEGLCAFVCKRINGVVHFAVQAKLECGNRDVFEFAPTVQCLTGNYRTTSPHRLPFLDFVLNAPAERICFDTMQSEEGGRFYREQNRNMILIATDDFPEQLPPNFIWMTLNQLFVFLKFNNFLNIQARSLIAAVSFV